MSARELHRRLVACQDYGTWTEEAAREWWASHAGELSQVRAEPSEKPLTRTLAMALGEPARGAA